MPYSNSTAAEIDKKLREDFRRRLKDFGISAELSDPLLAVLFRTFAQQLETLYSDTDEMRQRLLDELISNLGLDQRMARPAQTLVRFLTDGEAQPIERGTELAAEAQTGERLIFTTQSTFHTSTARIALALAYQDGALRLLSGVEIPDSIQQLRPSFEPVRTNLGPNPAIFLAVEQVPGNHLSQHTFFFELGPDALALQDALARETWCLVGPEGELSAQGILRPRAASGGLRRLEWLVGDSRPETSSPPSMPALPPGLYGPRLFLLPAIPPERRFTCLLPKAMEPALTRIFGANCARLFAAPRAWFRISMPSEMLPIHSAIGNIAMHAMVAANALSWNQTIYFERHGTSIPIQHDAGAAPTYPVALMAVLGEDDVEYVPQLEPTTSPRVGRYTIGNGRIDLRPALRPDGSEQAYANLRMWVTNGTLGNSVGPNRVTDFLRKGWIAGVRVTNPTAAAGGRNDEPFQSAHARFSSALLSRDRIVTAEDLRKAARAFDWRIREVRASPALERTQQGLRKVERVRVWVDGSDFLDLEAEVRTLTDELTSFLESRSVNETTLRVEVVAG